MNKAIFLDRDGTIIKEVDNLRNIRQIRLLPKVATAIEELNKNNYLIIVISNQPVVARGWITEKYLRMIHAEIARRLGKKAKLAAIYYCPHHPNANLKKYRKICSDRKPSTGLIKRAVIDFKIDLKKSYFVGDSTRDIQTAKNSGIKSILLQTGYKGKDNLFDAKPDYVAKNLYSAVSKIILCKQ